ncbi:unnamed protein product [Adineta ricciae]|uniref:Uncharacterized protein n=1 Tax=Adineta ricciae TaxID=249248 RepID=A0A815R3E4_ADIRI|nr:unnamed protein product [Adineta ricciae]
MIHPIMSLYWKNNLLCSIFCDTDQSIETYVVLNGYSLNMYGVFKITYHLQTYISTSLAKSLTVLFLKTSSELITLRSLYGEYPFSSMFHQKINDDQQTIWETNVNIIPSIF